MRGFETHGKRELPILAGGDLTPLEQREGIADADDISIDAEFGAIWRQPLATVLGASSSSMTWSGVAADAIRAALARSAIGY